MIFHIPRHASIFLYKYVCIIYDTNEFQFFILVWSTGIRSWRFADERSDVLTLSCLAPSFSINFRSECLDNYFRNILSIISSWKKEIEIPLEFKNATATLLEHDVAFTWINAYFAKNCEWFFVHKYIDRSTGITFFRIVNMKNFSSPKNMVDVPNSKTNYYAIYFRTYRRNKC